MVSTLSSVQTEADRCLQINAGHTLITVPPFGPSPPQRQHHLKVGETYLWSPCPKEFHPLQVLQGSCWIFIVDRVSGTLIGEAKEYLAGQKLTLHPNHEFSLRGSCVEGAVIRLYCQEISLRRRPRLWIHDFSL